MSTAAVSNETKVEQSVEPSVEQAKRETVAYETHQKLLSQRKADQARLAEMDAKLKTFEETEMKKQQAKLEEKGEYQKILEAKENELKSLQERIKNDEQRRINSEKESAFLNSLGGKLKNPEYIRFASKDEIAVDPDTGKVDELSLKQVVDKFLKEHSTLVDKKESNPAISASARSAQNPQFIQQTQNENKFATLAGLLKQPR